MEPSPEKAVDILVVDDNRGKMLALESALAPLGQNLVTASSGREALEQLLRRDFATIILDVSMPDIDGFETARLIRARPRSAHTPIIFVSAVNLDEIDARRGYSLGAVDYIFAPIVPEVLRAKVSVFVQLHRKTEEARLHAQRLEERTRELEQSQRQLRLAERMAAIGTLSAGLGHDIGNLLLPIVARLDSLRPEQLPEDARENIESIRTCVTYLRKLCNGLRMLALDPDKGGPPETTHLHDWWTEICAIFRNALPRGIALEFDCPEGVPPVRMARHRLTQAVFNLVQNAGEALRDAPDGHVRVWARAEDDATVRIGVTDNGPGMSAEVLSRCFDPFYTTKSRGISTGLGLALVHGIVQREGAHVNAESRPGRGATFSFAIAAAEAEPAIRPLAIVTLRERRLQGFTAGLVRRAGFDVTFEHPREDPSAALWLADPEDDLQNADAFIAGRNDRRVLVFAGDSADPPADLETFTLDRGGGMLREKLAEFLRACVEEDGREEQQEPASADPSEELARR